MPALDPQARRRLDGPDGRGSGELVEQGHLTEDVAGLQLGELVLAPAAVLDRLDAALFDGERTDAGVSLAHDVLADGVALLDGRVRDRLERLAIEVLEQPNMLQEFDVVGHAAGA